MVHYIATLAKYFILIFVLLYTFECFYVFRYKDEAGRKGSYIRQIVLIILFHFTSFLCICLKTGEIKYLYFYAIFQILLLLMIEAIPMLYPQMNRLLINNAGMLISIGIVALTRLDFDKAVKQFVIVMVSFILGAFIPFVIRKIKKIPDHPVIYAGAGILLLVMVLLVGTYVNGSKLAFNILGLSFQASEFVKILFVIFLAGALNKSIKIKNLLLITLSAAAHVFLLAATRDLGAALIFFTVFVLLVFVATRNYLYLSAGLLTGIIASIVSYNTFRHVRVRVQAFLDPFSVIDNEGYQITQSLFAISSGNWFGLGIYEGTPETIPYVETDFIFSAITEEMGVIFAICSILICLSCFIMFINIGIQFRNRFYRFSAYGLGFTYIFQVLLTVGGGTKFLPLTGVTLPFVSYGGSSVMATVFSFFIIEGMYISKGILKEGDANFTDTDTIKKENKIVLALMYVFVALFASLCIYLCIYVARNEKKLINNSYNPRQEVLIQQNTRGNIYSRDNEILATTIVRDNKDEVRYYPYGNVFSHVVGYAINGKSGIEGQANYYLINSNQPLKEKVVKDLKGEKYLGDSVITTLDVNLQRTAYLALGDYSGAVVVSNPKTGEILAIVSKPDFNPNELEDIWDDLINDNDSTILLNRATQGLYPPGSTFKIVTLLEYIKENPKNYNDYSFDCSGVLHVDGGSVSCFNHDVHGHIDLQRSLAISCNSSFGNLGLTLNRSSFQRTLNQLLFNEKLPLAMSYSQSSCIVNDSMSELEMVRTSFGQGDTLVTPIHMNMITQSVANDGLLMKPFLVDKVVNCNGAVVEDFRPDEYKSLFSKGDAQILTEMMTDVVESGTGTKLKNDKYTVAGKTGSAEYSDSTQNTHSWFTGFAPVEDPEICVTIILEDAGTSGLYAVPMAKTIFDAYFTNISEENQERK